MYQDRRGRTGMATLAALIIIPLAVLTGLFGAVSSPKRPTRRSSNSTPRAPCYTDLVDPAAAAAGATLKPVTSTRPACATGGRWSATIVGSRPRSSG